MHKWSRALTEKKVYADSFGPLLNDGRKTRRKASQMLI